MRTQQCHKFRHREVELFLRSPNAASEADLSNVVAYLESSVSMGEVFLPNQTIQTGWMVNMIREGDEGLLNLHEPDFKEVPIIWRNGLDLTIMHLRVQNDVVGDVALEPDFPSITQSAIVSVDLKDNNNNNIFMSRVQPEGSDSGWFVGVADTQLDYNDPSNLYLTSLYDVAIRCPLSVPFFALPEDTEVTLNGAGIIIVKSGKEITERHTGFLRILSKK